MIAVTWSLHYRIWFPHQPWVLSRPIALPVCRRHDSQRPTATANVKRQKAATPQSEVCSVSARRNICSAGAGRVEGRDDAWRRTSGHEPLLREVQRNLVLKQRPSIDGQPECREPANNANEIRPFDLIAIVSPLPLSAASSVQHVASLACGSRAAWSKDLVGCEGPKGEKHFFAEPGRVAVRHKPTTAPGSSQHPGQNLLEPIGPLVTCPLPKNPNPPVVPAAPTDPNRPQRKCSLATISAPFKEPGVPSSPSSVFPKPPCLLLVTRLSSSKPTILTPPLVPVSCTPCCTTRGQNAHHQSFCMLAMS